MVGTNGNGHILVVDDEREICDLVQEYLSSEGYRVSTVYDGAGMRRVMAQSPVDLVTLDLMLPGEDGLTLARWLRENSRVGIIMLTGRGEVVDHIIGLEMGADYYVAKPSTSASCWLRSGACCVGPRPKPRNSNPIAIEGTLLRLGPRSFEPGAGLAVGQERSG